MGEEQREGERDIDREADGQRFYAEFGELHLFRSSAAHGERV